MPPRSERIAAMVRSELTKDPQIKNDVLLKKAKAIDPSVRRLSPRQFHATYRLPVVRGTKTASKPPAPAKARQATASPPAAAPAPASTPSSAAPSAAAAPAPAQAPAQAPTPAAAPSASTAPAPSSHAPATHGTSSHRSTSTAVARPNAAEREAVRQILQLVAREALATEDRGSFIRLLDSLDERASVILGIFGRA